MLARISARIAHFRPGATAASAWLVAPALLLLLALSGGMASAGPPAKSPTTNANEMGVTGQTALLGGGQTQDPQAADGFNTLSPGQQARSMSSLVNADLVHPRPPNFNEQGDKSISKPKRPLSTITWGPAVNISNPTGGGNAAAAMHPTNPLLALAGGGNHPYNTTDGGLSWTGRPIPNCSNYGAGVPVWLASNFNGGNSAIYALRCNVGGAGQLSLGRSTDQGVTWAIVPANGLPTTGFFDDRVYLWTDHYPSSPYFGRTYLTEAVFDSAGSGSYNTVGLKFTTDGGDNWSPLVSVVAPNEFQLRQNHNEYPSLAIEPDGTIVEAWHRGMCCGGPGIINSPNKVMWARSTDGGVSFPVSGTVVTVPISQSVPFNATSPGGFRWSDAPNIAADPADGTLYAIWLAYRTPGSAASAAVYISRGTPDANSWTAPIPVYDNPNPSIFQYMPWVQVSSDHLVHVTYGSGTTSNTVLAQFYVQSTDRGATWSTPFQLSNSTFTPASFMGDYQALSVGDFGPGADSILATWPETTGGGNLWGRIGTFSQGTPTNTPTGTPASTATSTATGTPCTLRCSDVHPDDYFYEPMRYLFCLLPRGGISGYGDGTCRPYNLTTRSQLSKIVVIAEAWPIYTPPTPTFRDVPTTDTFYTFVETAYNHGIISGYNCGPGCLEFRPGNNVTRAQLCKIAVLAEGWPTYTPPTPTFRDVPPADPFYGHIETAYQHGIISGYSCGPNCLEFRPGSSATRGQICKIVYLAVVGP